MKNSQIIFNAVVVLLVVFAALQVEESCATSEDDDSFEKRLIGGNNALWALDSFARVVSAQQSWNGFKVCGGTAIHPQFILTHQKCINGSDEIHIFLYEKKRSKDKKCVNKTVCTRPIPENVTVITHTEGFNKMKSYVLNEIIVDSQSTFVNGKSGHLALIKIPKGFNNKSIPLCQSNQLRTGKRYHIVGSGQYKKDSVLINRKLESIDVQLLSNRGDLITAGSTTGAHAAHGDEGGPFFRKRNNRIGCVAGIIHGFNSKNETIVISLKYLAKWVNGIINN
ncbi:uncharacterized protein LOC142342480 isoform X2 [Convolutriloba macropyga]|uniref:uncharacterized protein LOC142342480 isoform X2 n=1 Tax=Convolutriloba macropyga TaxID=536237 RepID=UPI003F5230B4